MAFITTTKHKNVILITEICGWYWYFYD